MTKAMAARKLKFAFIIQILCAMALSSTLLAGQSGLTLTGSVQDQSGAALAGVKIALIRGRSNLLQETTSGPNGSFSFNEVSQGNYLLKAEAAGFSSHQEALSIGLQELKPVRIELKIAPVTQNVSVTLDP